jgi:hypothetical protein
MCVCAQAFVDVLTVCCSITHDALMYAQAFVDVLTVCCSITRDALTYAQAFVDVLTVCCSDKRDAFMYAQAFVDVLTVYCSDTRDALQLRTSEVSLRARIAELESALEGHELRARLTMLEDEERQAQSR